MSRALCVTVRIAPVQPGPDDPLPPGRKFGYLLHDYELYGLSRPSRNKAARSALGLPETVKVVDPAFMPMTRAWQNYWADLFSLSRFDKLYSGLSLTEKDIINLAFKSVTKGNRAFTNRRGWDDGYADYINGVNTNADPMEQETINCGGNVVELLSNLISIGGKDAYQVVTMDGDQLPPNPLEVNHKTAPWLVFKAIISRREGYDPRTDEWAREDLAIPFDQLQGHDVPIPFMGKGSFNYMEAERIRVLPDRSPAPDPYRR
ncbi:MAG TPA: hypothetical protein VJ821_12240 [Anaerolineales bacterium]|nr:hypothetical protein [Anaerolineales bacterium]